MITKYWNVWWTTTTITVLLLQTASTSDPKIRHSKHLIDNMAAGYTSSTGQYYSNDNHIPTFPDCIHYKPRIKEEQPTNTYVITVKAEDSDPIERGGNLTYSLVSESEQHKFHIDPRTGNITTKYMFNRDEPPRETEAYLIVRATDNGHPPLDGYCKFKVTIEDVNDNPPIFNRVRYEESIPQDKQVGSVVVRITATDMDDGLNKEIEYSLVDQSQSSSDKNYFAINKQTGTVTLANQIDKDVDYTFKIRVVASDKSPNQQRTSWVDLFMKVVESDKKAPYFVGNPAHSITLREDFNDRSQPVFYLEAESNTDEPAPIFTLMPGKTEQTNKQDTFVLKTSGKNATLYMEGSLDYERVKEYTLTIRITNKFSLSDMHVLTVTIEDVNDVAPKFTKEITDGSVLEDEPPGTVVMQVNAVDSDATPEFKRVSYELQDHKDKFAIDPNTGNITTKRRFDREEQDAYNVKVIARDSAPSAILKNGEPNTGEQVFRITIEDKNDHTPTFLNHKYSADIWENAEINSLVVDVKADDVDTASQITYSITSGNTNDAFYIEAETGRIKTNKLLDFETIMSYTLKVEAFDGLFKDECLVEIKVRNVNDEYPQFYPFTAEVEIKEETLISGCIMTVRAYDPDILDRTAPQHIVYSLVKAELKDYLTISNNGCLSLIKPLDRDEGVDRWQVTIKANDEDGPTTPTSKGNIAELYIRVLDINDNAPVLSLPQPVVWRENQPPGRIVELAASDKDSPPNGAPFSYSMDESASDDIRSKFAVNNNYLDALTEFDRESQKEYVIPIKITDSGAPPMTGVSYLRVVIGDENDHKMSEGTSSIFVYYYEEAHYDIQIGRVYVNDLDDWDLGDKHFEWESYNDAANYFTLDQSTGMITMSKVPAMSYFFRFRVTEDPQNGRFARHTVTATVSVTVKEIPAEAVRKSGSIRFANLLPEQFITKNTEGMSKADLLRSFLASAMNTSEENVDVFTVLRSPLHENETILDVRFSAHGSPYYEPERINAAIVKHQNDLENTLGAQMLMVGVDECLNEMQYCEGSCANELITANKSAPVFTNTTSFVGVYAYVDHKCQCEAPQITCYNGGILTPERRCQCPERTDGMYCEQTSIGFRGDGWALYPTLDVCNETIIKLHVRTAQPNGLIFYIGPELMNPPPGSPLDFMALEIEKGYLNLLVDYGTGTTRVVHGHNIIDDEVFHKVEIQLRPDTIQLIVDDCSLQNCLNLAPPHTPNKYLNVNGPLQVGGTYTNVYHVGSARRWAHIPTSKGFAGCIQNFTVNGKPYNLGNPSLAHKTDSSCSAVTSATFVFGFDWSFLIAIIICLVILTVLLMAVVVHRRKVEDMYRDTDDIRENIINYEDEGGGEGDMTGYDLNVLRLHYDGTTGDKYMNGMLPTIGADEVPDICGFLDDRKHTVDNDPETLPFDDVRHYAYEGDGNTSGSLSSLASGTDEGDLNFDYLSNFGPRFRKLADMYGEDGSDEDSDTYHNATSESWC